jgi:hypothetical protein
MGVTSSTCRRFHLRRAEMIHAATDCRGGSLPGGLAKLVRVHEKRIWRSVDNKLKLFIFLKKYYRIF